MKLAPDNDSECVQGGNEQDGQGRRGRAADGQSPLAGLEPVKKYNEAPADANEEPVGAGHVGGGEVGVIGDVGGGPGEVYVDGVFREDGDDGKDGDGEGLGDVDLGDFGGPGQGGMHSRLWPARTNEAAATSGRCAPELQIARPGTVAPMAIGIQMACFMGCGGLGVEEGLSLTGF